MEKLVAVSIWLSQGTLVVQGSAGGLWVLVDSGLVGGPSKISAGGSGLAVGSWLASGLWVSWWSLGQLMVSGSADGPWLSWSLG